MLLKEFLEFKGFGGLEIFRLCSQKGKESALLGELRNQIAKKRHKVILNNTYDMEAVRHDPGVWKPSADELSIGTTEVDANDFDPLASLKAGEKSRHFLFASPRHDVENLSVS